jgi:hypothetical protein
VAGNLNLDWPRYYVPTAFFGSLLVGVGIATLVRSVLGPLGERIPLPETDERIRRRLRS